MIILIPSYHPDERLLSLADDLRDLPGLRVLVVDDGSGPTFAHVFRSLEGRGVTVLRHPLNRGKGAALKTGFAHIGAHFPGEAVVCADSDGQHSPVDILRIAAALEDGTAEIVLGARAFTGTVPLRSRVGNSLTRTTFRVATGHDLRDTQTGLRGFAPQLLPWLLEVPGDRFEYELRQLLTAVRAARTIREIPIATIYLEGNASTHFRPVHDSLRIYGQLLAFVASSLAGFVVDALALAALLTLTGDLVPSIIGARALSATANYSLNRWWVFGRGSGSRVPSFARYAALAAVVLLANIALMRSWTSVLGSVAIAKVLTELMLFTSSFLAQRTLVFAGRTPIAQRAQRTKGAQGAQGARRTPGAQRTPTAQGGQRTQSEQGAPADADSSGQAGSPVAKSRTNPASSRMVSPSSRAFASLEPAPGPTTT